MKFCSRPNDLMRNALLFSVLLIFQLKGFCQLARQDKFSTFGIIARDSIEKTWGCAIATDNLGIGQYGVFEIEPEIGVIVSIAYTKPDYPIKGIKMLEQGYSLKKTIDSLLSIDESPQYRQIAMIDKNGKTLGYTGNLIMSYTYAGSIEGDNFIVFGNSFMNDQVLSVMASAFRDSKGKLYERLAKALISAQNAGGQRSGKMSSALCVKKAGEHGFNEVDVRVDYSLRPFDDLQKLIDKKKGIEYLLKSREQSSKDSSLFYLNKSVELMEGWTLMYTELSKEFYKLKRPDLAMKVLKLGIDKDKLFRNCLPWNYFLIGYKPYDKEISKMKFNIHDWLEALNSLIETKEFIKAEKTGKDNLSKFPDSSHLHLLVGKALEGQDKITEAKIYFKKAMELDKDNLEAVEKSK